MKQSGRARFSQFRPAVPPRAGARFSAARRCRPPLFFLPALSGEGRRPSRVSVGLERPEGSRDWPLALSQMIQVFTYRLFLMYA